MNQFAEKRLSKRAGQFVKEGVNEWIATNIQSKRTTEKDVVKESAHGETGDWRTQGRVFSRKQNKLGGLRSFKEQRLRMRGCYVQVGHLNPLSAERVEEFIQASFSSVVSIEKRGIKKVIEDAMWISELNDDWDDEGSLGYSKELLLKVEELLESWINKVWKDCEDIIPLPDVQPGPDGSIDLHWKKETYELLLNVPNDKGLVNFYGDDYKDNVMKGSFAQDAEAPSFLFWLYSVC